MKIQFAFCICSIYLYTLPFTWVRAQAVPCINCYRCRCFPAAYSNLERAGSSLQRGVSSYYSAKAPPLFLIISACPQTAGWRCGCHWQERNKGISIRNAILSWIDDILYVLKNTLKIQKELISFLHTVWGSQEGTDNVAGEGWDVRLPVRRTHWTVQKQSKYILKSVGLG